MRHTQISGSALASIDFITCRIDLHCQKARLCGPLAISNDLETFRHSDNDTYAGHRQTMHCSGDMHVNSKTKACKYNSEKGPKKNDTNINSYRNYSSIYNSSIK